MHIIAIMYILRHIMHIIAIMYIIHSYVGDIRIRFGH